VAKHLTKFAKPGLIIVFACDRKVCLNFKQATNERIAYEKKQQIKAFQLCKATCNTKPHLISEQMESFQRLVLLEEMKKMESNCKSCEAQASSSIPMNFASELERELFEIVSHIFDDESTVEYIESVKGAEFQAVEYMAGQVANQKAFMAMTRDFDISTISEDCCIAIKGFTKGQYEIFCLFKVTRKNAIKHLSKQSKDKFQPAKKPFFDGVSNHRLQELIMLILDCDVYLPIKSSTPTLMPSHMSQPILCQRLQTSSPVLACLFLTQPQRCSTLLCSPHSIAVPQLH